MRLKHVVALLGFLVLFAGFAGWMIAVANDWVSPTLGVLA